MATVEVDDKLLEEAVKATEQTPEQVVEFGLLEVVRVAALRRGIERLKRTKDVFWPNYLETIRPNSYAALEQRGETPDAEPEVERARRSG